MLVIVLVGCGSSVIVVVEMQAVVLLLVVVASAQNSFRYISTFVSQVELVVLSPSQSTHELK